MSILQMQTVIVHFYNTNQPFDRYKNARKAIKASMLLAVIHEFKICGAIKLLFYLTLFWTMQWYCNIPTKLYPLTHFFQLHVDISCWMLGRSFYKSAASDDPCTDRKKGLCSIPYLLKGLAPSSAGRGQGLLYPQRVHTVCKEHLGTAWNLCRVSLKKT